MMIVRKSLLLVVLCMPFHMFAQQAADTANDVLLLQPKEEVPVSARKVGKAVKVVDKGFKINCTYDDIVSEAKMKVKAAGGNILKVSEWRVPNAMSTCYGIIGEAYFMEDLSTMHRQLAHISDSIVRSLIPDTARYAVLYVYRPGGLGPLISYNLHLDDSVICRVHNDRYYAVRIYKEGAANLWTRTEARVDVPIDLRFGQAYFLKCGVAMGAFVGHPTMRIVDPKVAISQFRFDKVRQAAEAETE